MAINSLSIVLGSYIIATVGWQFLKVRSVRTKCTIPRRIYKAIEKKNIYCIYYLLYKYIILPSRLNRKKKCFEEEAKANLDFVKRAVVVGIH